VAPPPSKQSMSKPRFGNRDHPRVKGESRASSSVRLANAIHLSSWKGREVPFNFDDKDYLSELNKRIRDEGIFAERA
jgi:hypothetical protein